MHYNGSLLFCNFQHEPRTVSHVLSANTCVGPPYICMLGSHTRYLWGQNSLERATRSAATRHQSCTDPRSIHPGPWFNIKMPSYQYRKSHCGDKMVVRSSHLHNGISYTGKTTSLYWIIALESIKWPVNTASHQSVRDKHGDRQMNEWTRDFKASWN